MANNYGSELIGASYLIAFSDIDKILPNVTIKTDTIYYDLAHNHVIFKKNRVGNKTI